MADSAGEAWIYWGGGSWSHRWCEAQDLTFSVSIDDTRDGGLLGNDTVYHRKLGMSLQATPHHVRIILKAEIRK